MGNVVVKVILIDGMHLAYRMHYTHANLHTSDWVSTGVLHGVMSNLLRLQEFFPDRAMVFCWDEGVSWRTKVDSEYKANRHPTDVRLRIDGQVKIMREELLSVLGVKQLGMDGIEGDDWIGLVLAGLMKRNVEEVLIYSGDRDFYQLIDEKVKIIVSKSQEFELVDGDSVKVSFRIWPKDWIKFRALAGDVSDGLKAVDGIGKKTAAMLLGMGVDPSRPDVEEGMPSSVNREGKIKTIVENWNRVHMCYRLSSIPRRVDDIEVPDDVRLEISKNVDRVVRHPDRVVGNGNGKELLTNLARYELRYVISERRRLWAIP